MRLYQGGAIPGNLLRVVEVPGVEVEACGGTHVNNTGEIGKIRILKGQKIQDGIVRLTFTAGIATERIEEIRRSQSHRQERSSTGPFEATAVAGELSACSSLR